MGEANRNAEKEAQAVKEYAESAATLAALLLSAPGGYHWSLDKGRTSALEAAFSLLDEAQEMAASRRRGSAE